MHPPSQLAQPEQFQNLFFNIRTSNSAANSARLEGLEGLFKSPPETTRWVQSFKCMLFDPPGPELQLLSSVFVQLHSLRFIHLHQLAITPHMATHICSLPRLEWVGLLGGNRSNEWPDTEPSSDVPPIKILSIQVWPVPHSIGTKLASAPAIQELSLLGLGVVQYLHTIIQARPTNINFSNLSCLRLTSSGQRSPPDPDLNFFDFVSFPNLTCLQLSIPHITPDPTVDTSMLQLLKEFSGGYADAEILVPGRPIEKLRVECNPFNDALSKESLTRFASGTATLRSWAPTGCAWRDGCLGDIAQLFPSLTALELRLYRGHQQDWSDQSFFQDIRGLPCLRIFGMITTPSTIDSIRRELLLPLQLQLLEVLVSFALKLCEIALADRRWRLYGRGSWIAAYPSYMKTTLSMRYYLSHISE